MRKASNIHLIQIIILLVLSILNILVFKSIDLYKFAAVIFVFTVTSFIFCGYERNTYRDKKSVRMIMTIYLVLYFFITYFFGLFVGFIRSSFSLYFLNIIKNIAPFLLVIIVRECFRYLYFTKADRNKLLIILGVLFFVLLDVNMNIDVYNVLDGTGFLKMICFVVFTSISKNILLSYVTVKSGYGNALIYSVVMELSKFVLPLYPDFGDYINIVINVSYNVFLLLNINDVIVKKRKLPSSRYYKRNLSFYSVITVLLFIMVMLTSGYFKYYAIAIGSGSMTPKINKGDVVIVRKVSKDELETLKLKDVIAYHHDNIIVVHRLIDIVNKDNKVYYITKGDNNLTKDEYYIPQKDVIGKVVFNVRYIGYPTVSLNERIKKKE